MIFVVDKWVTAMTQRIVIDPVTRIEGHAKITIYLDESGQVRDARFHVTEFRGFEKFCEGRPLWEMLRCLTRCHGSRTSVWDFSGGAAQ